MAAGRLPNSADFAASVGDREHRQPFPVLRGSAGGLATGVEFSCNGWRAAKSIAVREMTGETLDEE